jgi:hypothetical protein
MNGFLKITLFVIMPLAFMHAGTSLMLALIARPDKKHPLNPRALRRDAAIIIGAFGGLTWAGQALFLIIALLRKDGG